MTALKHSLQREVFKPNEERLIAVVNVTKAGKKKKASFLCAAGTVKTAVGPPLVEWSRSSWLLGVLDV